MSVVDVSVLVVGGGPVGLALAGDLGWRGVSSVLVERSDGVIVQPKMDMVGVRTMEFCRRWGIVGDVEGSPYPLDYPQDNVYVTSVVGFELGRERVGSYAASVNPPQSPQRRHRCPQDMFDPILQRFARRSGRVDLRYETEFVSVEDRGDHVVAVLEDRVTGRRSEVSAQFLVGCDGPSSRVRGFVGTEMSGQGALTYTTNIIFRSTELPGLHDKGLLYRFIVIGPEGTWATIVAINGGDRWRMSIVGTDQRREFGADEIDAAIRRAVGTDFEFEVLSVLRWTRQELVADRYSAGRVFLAGDAAHVMSPTGGFGMNTGIGDAVDLSWKLAGVIEGWGGPELLESYHVERRPVAVRNMTESSGNLGRMLSPRQAPPGELLIEESERGERFRSEFGVEFSETMKREWHTSGIHLGYRYDDSPVCVPDGTERPPVEVMRYTQTSRPGARAPHVWLQDGRSTLDLFGHGFVLLRLGPNPPDCAGLQHAADTLEVPFAIIDLDEPDVNETYENYHLVLVRPDGHVAWRANHTPNNPTNIINTTTGWNTTNTHHTHHTTLEESR